ncbi:hypothetical protein H5410_032027 [Solanum commersonii]|uniref:Uncharacterized protein n=1 Tax=Solanum commersonii TaxID=4109 RepID=A0A9J5YK00_SOLCO|nr:hypothetical protein H5410_032027 [Solanum commersonii]
MAAKMVMVCGEDEGENGNGVWLDLVQWLRLLILWRLEEEKENGDDVGEIKAEGIQVVSPTKMAMAATAWA